MSGKHFEMVFMPRVKIDREVFRKTFPGFSTALDGIVDGPSEFWEADPNERNPKLRGPKQIFDHHEGCVRDATLCTAKQVNRAIRTGLFEAFKQCGHPRITAYAQDADDDVMLATYQLRHPAHANRKRLKEMVELVDLLDTVNGFYPVQKRWHLLKMQVWVMEPYAEARMSVEWDTMTASAMHGLMEKMHERMRKTMYGYYHEVEPDTRYKLLEAHGKFAVIEEIGRYARYELAKKGFTSFLAVTKRADGLYRYTIARRSPYIVDRPIKQDYIALNILEGKTPKGDKWGGSTLGGGSPQDSGSRLTPNQVVAVLLSNTQSVRDNNCNGHH